MDTDPLAEAYARALEAERARNGRQFAFFRLGALAAVFAANLFFGVTRITYHGVSVLWLGLYWVAAGGVVWASRRSEIAARWSGLAIPFIDMPVIFLLIRDLVHRLAEGGFATDASAVATQLPLFFLLMILAGSLSLDIRLTWLSAAVALALQSLLLLREGLDLSFVVIVCLTTVLATTIGTLARRRSIDLVRQAALEQARRERLGRYFSPQVAEAVGNVEHGLGRGQSREVTVLFADLRGFTALAEQLTGEEVVSLLNEFHSRMVDRVFAHDGTLDKYLGDGLMAYFGAPVPHPDHAARAVGCAVEMQAALAAMNRDRTRRGVVELRMGVGVHTGKVVLGDIGAERRREYTAVGDTVNVAARIEQLTKTTGVGILVSESTRALVDDPGVRFTPMEPLAVRGKSAPLQLYRVESGAEG